MTPAPPLPQKRRRSVSWRIWCLIALGFVPGFIYAALVILRLMGLFRPFYIPKGGMAPALSPGDRVAMEGITFLERSPRRGDIVVFKTDQIDFPGPSTIWAKRVAGVPGDHLSISDGKLFIDEKLVDLSNSEGTIVYHAPYVSASLRTNVIVPAGCYYLLGDNSSNSFDSRYFGPVPRKEILGRIVFCYWPPSRMGTVK